MKKLFLIFTVVCLLISSVSCAKPKTDSDGAEITDTLGNTVKLSEEAKVVSLYASFADCWMLSGGTLVGVTEDAEEEHKLDIGKAEIVGSVKQPSLEKIVALNPDYVILSADLAAHMSLKGSLDSMGLAYGYFRVDTFGDYKALMEQFCAVNNRPDLLEKNVTDVENKIEDIKSKIPKTDKSVLLIRAFSTGMKAKRDDNLAGYILNEFGLKNIADEHDSMLEDLSLEEIVLTDPDYIFVTTMGSEEGAKKYLEDVALNHPAWSELTAVKNGNYHMLPKELFHYKPNNRWSESYEYLAKIIWPEIFGE